MFFDSYDYLSEPRQIREFYVKNQNLGQTEKQRILNEYLAYYLGIQYDDRAYSWILKSRDTEFLAEGAVIEFDDRIPRVQTGFAHFVVEEHTNFLYGGGEFPGLVFESKEGDKELTDIEKEATSSFISKIVNDGLKEKLYNIRNRAGALGNDIVILKLVNGQLKFDGYRPQDVWRVEWQNKYNAIPQSIEIRYQFVKEIKDRETPGKTKSVTYWYRRVIDFNDNPEFDEDIENNIENEKPEFGQVTDIIYFEEKVNGGEEPNWTEKERYEYKLQRLPVIWVINRKSEFGDSWDGLSDFHKQLENIKTLDETASRKNAGAFINSDPERIFATNHRIDKLKLGPQNAVRLGQGDSASLLETSGAGFEIAQKETESLLGLLFRNCHLLNIDPEVLAQNDQNASFLRLLFARQIAYAIKLRVQAERTIKQVIDVAMGLVFYADGSTEYDFNEKQKLNPADYKLLIKWSDFFQPTLSQIERAITIAQSVGVKVPISLITAAELVHRNMQIENSNDEFEKMKNDKTKHGELLEIITSGQKDDKIEPLELPERNPEYITP